MKLSNDKAMEGAHVKDDFKIALVCEAVWVTLCALHKNVLRKS